LCLIFFFLKLGDRLFNVINIKLDVFLIQEYKVIWPI